MGKVEQTPLEWLIEQLRLLSFNPKTHLGMGDIRVTKGLLDDLLKQAKKKEKQQAFEYFKAGQDSMEEGGKSFEQYYT
jgi:hypothetical protein